MDSSLRPYNYTTLKPDYYSFTTDAGDDYVCYFISYASYFAGYPDIASSVYGFNIERKNKQISHTGVDKRIALTIVNIVA